MEQGCKRWLKRIKAFPEMMEVVIRYPICNSGMQLHSCILLWVCIRWDSADIYL